MESLIRTNSAKNPKINLERSPIGDAFVRIEERIQDAAKLIDSPKGKKAIREFSPAELKLLDAQIEECNNLNDLAKIYNVAPSDMCKILIKNGKDTLDMEVQTLLRERNFALEVNRGRFANLDEIKGNIEV